MKKNFYSAIYVLPDGRKSKFYGAYNKTKLVKLMKSITEDCMIAYGLINAEIIIFKDAYPIICFDCLQSVKLKKVVFIRTNIK